MNTDKGAFNVGVISQIKGFYNDLCIEEKLDYT